VTVDEPRDSTAPAAVDLFHVVLEQRQVAHPPDRLDLPLAAEDERVLEQLDLAEPPSAERRVAAGRRRELREVADEQPGQSQPSR